MSSRAAYAALAIVAAAAAAYQLYAFISLHAVFSDFHAFWCAGSVLAAHGNPYHAAAMMSCERATAAIPAPLPGYALAVFRLFAFLPYTVAAAVWFALSLAATVACIILSSHISGAPRPAAAWAFVLPATAFWLPYGETVPFALAGILYACVSAEKGRYVAVAAGLALAALAPVIAIGAWIAALLFVPKLRVPVLLAGIALCAVWTLTGPNLAIEYVRAVLPIHALAELPRAVQYSAAWLAYAAGAAPAVALRIGTISSVVSLLAGLLLAWGFARRGERAAVLLAPVALGVAGGAFVHAGEIAAAIPFALWLAMRERGASRACAVTAVVLLALPWYELAFALPLIVPAAIAAAVLAALLTQRVVWGSRAALCTLLLACAVLYFDTHNATVRTAQPAPAALVQNAQDASASWGRAVWKNESRVTVSLLAAKVPLWVGLSLIIGGAFAAVFSNEKLVALVCVDRTPFRPLP